MRPLVVWSAISAIGSMLAAGVLLLVFLLDRDAERKRREETEFDEYLFHPVRARVLSFVDTARGSSGVELRVADGEADRTQDDVERVKALEAAHTELATSIHFLALAFGHVPTTVFLVRRLGSAWDRFAERAYEQLGEEELSRQLRDYTQALAFVCQELRVSRRSVTNPRKFTAENNRHLEDG